MKIERLTGLVDHHHVRWFRAVPGWVPDGIITFQKLIDLRIVSSSTCGNATTPSIGTDHRNFEPILWCKCCCGLAFVVDWQSITAVLCDHALCLQGTIYMYLSRIFRTQWPVLSELQTCQTPAPADSPHSCLTRRR